LSIEGNAAGCDLVVIIPVIIAEIFDTQISIFKSQCNINDNRPRPNQWSESLIVKLSVELNYLTSTTAPASSNCFFKLSASSLVTPVLTSFGAPSTKSLASFKPKPVKSFTNLTTANF